LIKKRKHTKRRFFFVKEDQMVVHDVLGSSSEMHKRVMDIVSSIPPFNKKTFFFWLTHNSLMTGHMQANYVAIEV